MGPNQWFFKIRGLTQQLLPGFRYSRQRMFQRRMNACFESPDSGTDDEGKQIPDDVWPLCHGCPGKHQACQSEQQHEVNDQRR